MPDLNPLDILARLQSLAANEPGEDRFLRAIDFVKAQIAASAKVAA